MSPVHDGHSERSEESPLTFHLIPHTHWDREWYLPRAAFQARLVPVLDEALEQLERDPDARFVLDGQTVLLEDYLAARPEQEARIAALVRRGALEIGPWYVLSDLLIPSAASLRRNLAEGKRDAGHFGRRLDVLYSPDAFGHPADLPCLAAEFGIRRAVIRRGLGKPQARDRDLYRWEAGADASVLVYHLPAGGYDMAIGLAEAGADLAQVWPPLRRELVERAGSHEIAVFLGADHHAMVRDLAGLRARLQALEPGHEVRVSGLTEFFEAVERAGPEVPTLRGELRRAGGHTWVLPGIHSTRSRLKRQHAAAELALSRIAEPLAGLALEQNGTDRGGLLRLAWRALLQSQFHDTLAGTTCDAAQREQEVRLAAVSALSGETATQSLHELIGHDPDAARGQREPEEPRLVLWNPSARRRSAVMIAALSCFREDVLVGAPSGRRARLGKGYQPFSLIAETGEEIPVQVLSVRREQERLDARRHYPDQDTVDRVWAAFRAPVVPGLGVTALSLRPARRTPAEAGLEVAGELIANPFLAVQVSPVGSLTLTDRRTGARYPNLCELIDEPDQGDTYTFSRGAGGAARGGRPVSQGVLARGPLVGALETRWSMALVGRGELDIRLVVSLYADSPIVRLRLEIANRGSDHRLRGRFPVGGRSAAVAGAAFGVEQRAAVRPAGAKDAIEQEAPTAPAQRFVAAAEKARGLALFGTGCFEYEWTTKGDLFVTLLRSVGELSRGELSERPGHAAWPMTTPLAQEPGLHTIDLALLPVGRGDLALERLEQFWEDAMLPVQAVFLRHASAPARRSPRKR